MKGKVIRGRGFRGCLNYLLGPLKQARIIAGNLLGTTPKAMSQEFAVVRQLRRECEKPVLHIPLRQPKGEDISDDLWRKIAIRYFELMDISLDRPWTLVKHPDEHTHILTSRISYLGEIWHGKWEGLNHIAATQTLEKEFGLHITPGLEGADVKNVRLTSGQFAKFDREEANDLTPEIPAKIHIAERIEMVLAECDGTFADFKKRLGARAVTIKLNQSDAGKVSGISFEFNQIVIKGSKIARAYSWQRLAKLLAERKKIYENQSNEKQNEAASDRTNPDREFGGHGQGIDRQGESDSQPNRAVEPPTAPPIEVAVRDTTVVNDRPLDVATAPIGHDEKSDGSPVPTAITVARDQPVVDDEHRREQENPRHDSQLDQELCVPACAIVKTNELTATEEETKHLDDSPPPPAFRR